LYNNFAKIVNEEAKYDNMRNLDSIYYHPIEPLAKVLKPAELSL